MDKYEVISSIITKVDKLMDARGIEKASLGVEIVRYLGALAKGLGNEDKAHAAEKKLLEDQLDERNKKVIETEDGMIVEGGETYTIDLENLEEGEDGTQIDSE